MGVPKGINTIPATRVILVTPSDSVNLAYPARAIRATGAGNVAVVCYDATVVVCAFAAGETRHIYATRINSTSTTATGLEAMI